MSSDSATSAFLVDPHSDPVAIRIEGRASFQNCSCVKDFLSQMIAEGKRRIVIDFFRCTSMDSTFLGVLAGVAIELRKLNPPGSLVLSRLGPRNLELVCNLGLNRLLIVDTGEPPPPASGSALECTPIQDEIAQARMVLEAHENLVAVDAANRSKFQDVLTFLKQQVDESGR